MPASYPHSIPEFLLDAHGCWYPALAETHTSISTRPLDDVFLARSSPSGSAHVPDDFADYYLSLPSFDHPVDWTPSRSLLSPCPYPLSQTPNRPTLPLQPRDSTLITPYLAGGILSPWSVGTDPVDRKFPNPFVRTSASIPFPFLLDQENCTSTVKSSFSTHDQQTRPAPLSTITNLQDLSLLSSPCPSFCSSSDTSSTLTWSSSSSTASLSPIPHYMNSPSISRGPNPPIRNDIPPPLPALHLVESPKTRLSSLRTSLPVTRSAASRSLSLAGRKRKSEGEDGGILAVKRARASSADDVSSSSSSLSSSVPDERARASAHPAPRLSQRRTFPVGLPINPDFQQMYIRHPVSSFVSAEPNGHLSTSAVPADGTFNKPPRALDLYTPRWVQGVGKTKQGMCPICAEDTSRGGASTTVWLSMKQSAFNYHMLYKHGISPAGLPFSPPTAFRTVAYSAKTVRQRTTMREGRCHKCKHWVALDTVKKDVEMNVKELFWWKHTARCHGASRMDGDGSPFIEDSVHARILSSIDSHSDSES